jgi:hypothetical protein
MPPAARRHIRKMRGGAQSHLIEADNGHFYVVKFLNNPQHRRILVNELIASALLEYLQIEAPETTLLEITPDFIKRYPDARIMLGTKEIEPVVGWHFGSRYPGDPSRVAVYDFVPDAILPNVANLPQFAAMLAFDKWISNADARQCVFFRERLAPRSPSSSSGPGVGFVAKMIDHGFAFQGPNWEFLDVPLQGLYPRHKVYDCPLEDFEQCLNRVVNFPEEVLDSAWKHVPPEWIEGEEDELERLLTGLMKRRKRVPDLIRDAVAARPASFPAWSRP